MPPALVPLALVAIGIPSALHAATGRPRRLGRAWLLSLAAVVVAQVGGELTASRLGVLGDAQLLFAALASVAAAVAATVAEGGGKR